MKCKQCNKTIEQTGNRERLFCDDKCRMNYKRQSKANILPEQIQSEQPIIQSGQPKADNLGQTPYYSDGGKKEKTFKQVEWSGKTIPNNPTLSLCKGCQKPVHHLVDICHECIKAGLTRKKLDLPDIEMDKSKFIPNWKKNKMTHTEAIERAIHAIASIGCDCIVGNKIYESSRVLRVKI